MNGSRKNHHKIDFLSWNGLKVKLSEFNSHGPLIPQTIREFGLGDGIIANVI